MLPCHRTILPALLVGIAVGCSGGSSDREQVRADESTTELDDAAPSRWATVDGREFAWPPTADPDAKAVVYLFLSSTCPIANGYAPEINRLHEEYEPRGIRLCLVHTESDLTVDAAREHAAEFALAPPVVLDSHRELVRSTGVRRTPEAAVLSPAGELLYRGRIDDRFPDIGMRKPRAHATELRDALDDLLAGRPVAVPRTEAIGCFIEAASAR